MNLREFWAAEAAKLRDTSALLNKDDLNITDLLESGGSSKIQSKIILVSKLIFDNNVKFGSNAERNLHGFYDKTFWETDDEVKLYLKVGVKANEAIDSIIYNTSKNQTLDCAQFVEVVRLGAILKTDGIQAFNKRYKSGLLLDSHGSTGLEIEKFYARNKWNERLAIDNNPDRLITDTLEQVLTKAPIGSKIAVSNFIIDEIAGYGSTYSLEMKTIARSITKRGWENENMIKIGNNQYAAFGIDRNVTLDRVKTVLCDIHMKEFKLPEKERINILKKIGISRIGIFKRN